MKNILLALICIIGSISAGFSQEISYGLKGGLNYAMGPQITGVNTGTPDMYSTDTFKGKSKIGYHGGLFVQVNFGKFFVRPELTYTSLKTEFDFPQLTSTYSVEKFDVPFLLGYNIYGPIDVFLGPIYSNIINSNLSELQDDVVIVVQNSPINFQAGFNVDIGRRFGVDVRYERTLSAAEPQGLGNTGFPAGTGTYTGSEPPINVATFDDARLHQIIVGVYVKLGGPGLNRRMRRACY